MSRVKVGEHYFLKSNAYVIDEKFYFAKGLEAVLEQITHGATQFLDKRKKIMQFVLIFHLLNHGHPMIEYTIMQTLSMKLNVPNNPMKLWSNGSRWEMTNYMFKQVLKQTHIIVIGASFISLSVNEVIIVDN
jgi:hypothetical protein